MAEDKNPSPLNQKFNELLGQLRAQFSNLDPRNPVLWPPVPRYTLLLLLAVAVVVVLWFLWLTDVDKALEQAREQENRLREEYKTKLAKAINLEALRKQREQVLQYVTQLEKQLPSKAEMDTLLSDINQVGVGRNLQFELFRPGQLLVRDYYAELPITIKVTGRYHDIASFSADIANLSRIVTLNNLSLTPIKDGLSMDATAKTFRYLDKDEIRAQPKSPGAQK